jgi:glycosyltransferase involved in cell wall biosynthesis
MTVFERTSVLIPAFDEESAITGVIAEIRNLGNWKEIIVVDDGSADGTAAAAERAGAKVVRHPYNKGNGAAVKSAVRAAEGEFILLMDADGQHPPSEITKLTDKLENYDLIVGARSFGNQATLSRGLGNAALNRFASMLSGFTITDLTSGFRAAKRSRFREFLHLLPNGFSYPATSTLAFIKAGYSVCFVPFEGQKRGGDEKSKMRPWREGSRFVMLILRMITLFSPLRIFFPISLVFFLVGFGYMVYTIATEIHVTNTSVLLITGAAVLFLFGLLSEQIAALRFERTGRD